MKDSDTATLEEAIENLRRGVAAIAVERNANRSEVDRALLEIVADSVLLHIGRLNRIVERKRKRKRQGRVPQGKVTGG